MSRVRKPLQTVALFPFLAVLICAMGVLIVLLVVQIQNARLEGQAAARDTSSPPAKSAAELETLRLEQETQAWRAQVFDQQRSELAAKLAERRLMLGHAEEHLLRLKDQAQQLQQQAEQLKQAGGDRTIDGDFVRQQVAELNAKIAAAEKELAEARDRVKNRKPSYALIPYDGPNGTRRRPIYIECLPDAIVLQPEGLRLTSADFEGRLTAGNPLDAALRAIREHIQQQGAADQGEPYPLLVVRPGGAESYSAARAAMKSWDSEFGYELINAELVLAYPPPDPHLLATLERTVADARLRQEALAAVAPLALGRSGNGGGGSGGGYLRASPNGGFERVGGNASGSPGTHFASFGGNGSGSGGAGGTGGGQPGADSATEPGNTADAKNTSSPNGTEGPALNAAQGNTAQGTAGAAASNNLLVGGPKPPNDTSTPSGNATAAPNVLARPGQTIGSGGAPPLPGSFGFSGENLAQQRGENWGLPNAAGKSTAVTRPIRVLCGPDRLVLLPERGDGQYPVEVPVVGGTRAGIDPFVAALWKRMDGWGLAGPGMYWKPVLKTEALSGGETRQQEFRALLQGSGIVVE